MRLAYIYKRIINFTQNDKKINDNIYFIDDLIIFLGIYTPDCFP